MFYNKAKIIHSHC